MGRLDRDLDTEMLAELTEQIALTDGVSRADDLIVGRGRGRLIISINVKI